MRKWLTSESDTYVYGERMATLVRWATLSLAFLLNNLVGGTDPRVTTFLNGLVLVVAILNLIPTIILWRGFRPNRWSCRVSLGTDIFFLTAVIFLRGGLDSTIYVLYFPVIFSVAIRFGLWESLFYALVIDATYAIVALAGYRGETLTSLHWAKLFIQLMVFAATAGVSGMLADREKTMRVQRAAGERIMAETQRRLAEQGILQEINQVILQNPADLHVILDGVAHMVRQRLDCDILGIFLLQEEQDELELRAVSYAGVRRMPARSRLPLGLGVCGRVAQTGLAVNVSDLAGHPLYHEVFPNMRAELCVPLLIEERVLGVIDATNAHAAAFSADDQRLLGIIAGQVAIAAENARLFAESQRQVTELTTLNQIGRALASTLHQEDLMELIYRQTGRVMNASNFYIALYDEAEDTIRFPLTIKEGKPQKWRTWRGANGPAEYVIRTRQPLLVAHDAERRFQELGIEFPGQVPCSWLGVPLLIGDRVLGVVAVHSYDPARSYDRGHKQVLSTIATQAAVALENTRLYDEARRQAERTAILNWVSTMVGAFKDLQDALDAIATSTQAALGCQKAVIFESNPVTRSLVLKAAQNLEPALAARLREWMPDPSGPTATATGQGWFVEDAQAMSSQIPAPFAEIDGLRAWMEVPLRGKEGILGSLLAGYDQPHLCTAQEEELLTAFAAQATVALETAHLAQKTERRARELSTLYEVGQAITSSLDLDTVLDRIMHQAIDLLEVEAGSLVLVESETRDLVFRIALGPTGDQVQGLRLAWGTGVVGMVAENGQPMCVNDAQNDPRFYAGADALSGFHTRSILATPLSSRDRIIGVIEVMNRTDGRPFLSEHMDLLTAFAAQAAIAIENAQLYRQADEALTRHMHELTTIAEIDHRLSATLDFESVNDLVIDGAMKATGASAGMMAILDESGVGLLLLSQRGYPDSIRRYQFEPWPVDQGLIGRAVRTGQPVLAADVYQDPDYANVFPAMRSQLSVPVLREDDQVIGVATVASDRLANFTEEDLRFVQHLAEHAAIAMQNARLFAELQRANRDLQDLSDAKTEFVSIVAHELRAPMTSIKGYVDLILEDEEVNEIVHDFLLVVKENTDRLSKLVADLLDVSRIESGRVSLSCQPVCLPDVVDSVVSTSATDFQGKHLAVTVQVPDDLPLVYGDQDRVTQILTNLVNNAIKYTRDEGQVSISARPAADGCVEISVADTGIGIAPEDQLRLFDKFFRADHPQVRRVPGTGLGLSIVKSLVDLHQGRIWVESRVDEGSTFHFTLPIATGEEPLSQV